VSFNKVINYDGEQYAKKIGLLVVKNLIKLNQHFRHLAKLEFFGGWA